MRRLKAVFEQDLLSNTQDMFHRGYKIFDPQGNRILSEIKLLSATNLGEYWLDEKPPRKSNQIVASLTTIEPKPESMGSGGACRVCGSETQIAKILGGGVISTCSKCRNTDWPNGRGVMAKSSGNPDKVSINLQCDGGVCRLVNN